MTGLYRHVRNPMYIAVVGVILGQALLLGDVRLLWYGALFWLACHIFWRCTKNRRSSKHLAWSMRPFGLMSRVGFRG